jgi:pheromone shutdown protein TraB
MPRVAAALLDERDEHLVRALLAAEGRSVVGVVGCAHVAGIEERWDDPKYAPPGRLRS